MRKLLLLEHVSLDGYAAGPHGEINWIWFDEELSDYVAPFTDRADTAIYGRVTYDMMNAYWPTAGDRQGASKHDLHHSRWYNSATKLVVSRTLQAQGDDKTRVIGDDLGAAIQEVKSQPGRDLLMIGSLSTAKKFMRLGLIDEYVINVNPVILGAGISLFGAGERINLRLVASRTFASGVVGLRYEKA
jgi:dihydrofolate reductase